MWNSTSACVMIATMTTPSTVAATLTWPPASTAPPITGAAKDRISQSSPIVGWPICRRATRQMPASAASRPGDRMGRDDRAAHRDAGQLGRMRIAADGQDEAPERQAVEQVPDQRRRRSTVGTTSQGSGPSTVVLPKAFTLSGTP